MKYLMRIISWNHCYVLSISILPIIIFFSFYGLYTNKFYFLKIDNYIFSLLVIIHIMFLNTLRRLDKDPELSTHNARNLEFIMYAIYFVYIFKLVETSYILLGYFEYSEQLLPPTFLPIGIFMLFLQVYLLILTFTTFMHRRDRIGPYTFDKINEI